MSEDQSLASESSLLRRHQSLNLRTQRSRNLSSRTMPTLPHSRTNSSDLDFTSTDHEIRRSRSSTTDGLINVNGTPHSGSSGSGNASPIPKSPLEGIGRTPWSPTPDDDAILGGSQRKRPTSFTAQEGLGISGNPHNGTSSPGLEEAGQGLQSLSLSGEQGPASPKPTLTSPIKRSMPSLTPLITSFEGKPKSSEPSPTSAQTSFAPSNTVRYQGPFSAAAYVRPIGHSFTTSRETRSDAFTSPIAKDQIMNSKGAFTAAPGVGRDMWARQKAIIAGQIAKPDTPLAESNEEEADYQESLLQTNAQPRFFPPQPPNHPQNPPMPFLPPSQQMPPNAWPPSSNMPLQGVSFPPQHPAQPRWQGLPSFSQQLPKQPFMHNPYQQQPTHQQQDPYNIAPRLPPPPVLSDVEQMMEEKGYNPIQFNTNPQKVC